MKRLTLLFVGLLSLPFFSYSGGIVTNQNQSAAYIRMFARDASTDIDAVFFNPAGLTKLDDGFYISLNNQYISQNKSVISNYPYLNDQPSAEYLGEIRAPLFPGIYAAYKKGKFAISLGINPVGGGGGATFNNGLPSFETGISDLVPALTSQGVTAYSLDAYLEGTSVFWGYQLGVSYEINDMFSVFAGARYISAKNTYLGHLQDINITIGGAEMAAADFFGAAASQAAATAGTLQGIIDVNAAYADATLDMVIADPDNLAALQAGYASIGLDPATATVGDGLAGFTVAGATATAKATLLADQSVDVEQTGSGFTPILGVNISPNDKLNIGLKYEFKTEMELENSTKEDFLVGFEADGTPITMFPDGAKISSDMPAMFSVGFDYKITDKFTVASGFHMYFDKNANYGRKLNGVYVENDQVIDRNSTEFALGLQYDISEKLLLSIGYLHTETGVTEDYQTDLSYSNHSNSVGFGGAYAISQMIDLNLSFGYTVYNDAQKIYDINNQLGQTITTTETYDKNNLFIGLGLDFKLGGKKSE
jgi:long-subunit fatty acid transport protein